MKSQYLAGWQNLLGQHGGVIGYGSSDATLAWKCTPSALVQKKDGYPDKDDGLTVNVLAGDLVDGHGGTITPAYRDAILIRKDGDPVSLSQGADKRYYLSESSDDYLIYHVDKIVFLSGVYRLHCRRNLRPRI